MREQLKNYDDYGNVSTKAYKDLERQKKEVEDEMEKVKLKLKS